MKVIVTAIGGALGQAIANILRKARPTYDIIGLDMSPYHAGKLYIDNFFEILPASHTDYLNELNKLIENNKIDILIPCSEQELQVIVNNKSKLSKIHIITVSSFIVNNFLDKLKTIQLLDKIGVPVPWTKDADTEQPIAFPCIMKPRFSSGSRQILRVTKREHVELYRELYPGCVFQEMLEPYTEEITCVVFRSGTTINTIQLARLLVGGMTSWARVIKNKDIDEILIHIAKEFDLNGSINVQLRLTDKGPRIFEINPRFSSTIRMRHLLGFSDLLWSIDQINGEIIPSVSVPEGKIVARIQEEVLL